MFLKLVLEIQHCSNFFLTRFTMPCIFLFTLQKEWRIILYSCGCFSSMDFYMCFILFFPENGDTCCQRKTLSKKPGRSCCMICTFEKCRHLKINIMQRNALHILRS